MLLDVFTRAPAKTYGTLHYRPADDASLAGFENGYWQIRAQPHVLMELKRLFPGFRQDYDGSLTLADTPEVAYKVAWMQLMYPLVRDDGTDRHLEARARERVATREAVESILNGGHVELRDGAYEPAIDLFPHQREAAVFAHTTGHLLLLDETGAMKTGSALTAAANPELLPALVVAPPHLLRQWMRELHRFFPMLRGHIVTSGKVYDPAQRRGMNGHDPDVLFITYGMLAGWADYLNGKVRTVILEEAHEVRRNGTQKYKAAAVVARGAVQQIGVTATPVFNYGDEVFNIVDVLAPGALGSRREFYAEWCVPTGNGKQKVKNPAALGSYLRDAGLVLKRTLREVGINLPGIVPMPFEVDVDGDEFDRLTADARSLAQQIVDRAGTPFELMQAEGNFDMRMRQATGIAKAPHVAALCKMLLSDESVGKLILFGWHRAVYEIWLEQLAAFEPAMYTGTESIPQKEISKARFIGGEARRAAQEKVGERLPESRILIVSLRSGAGLDGLQHVAHTVVHGELDWSPAPHDQGDGRLDRPGQTVPVLSYRPYCDFGTDPFMLQVLDEKRRQGEGITDPDRAIFEPTNADPERIRKVAAAFLERHAGRPEPAQAALEVAA